MPPVIDKTKCNECGVCVNICPGDVYFGSAPRETPTIAYADECWHCNACVLDCAPKALKLRMALPMLAVYK